MTTKEKMLVGLMGLKEVIAKQDVELLAFAHARKSLDGEGEFQDRLEEFTKLKLMAEDFATAIDSATEEIEFLKGAK